MLTTGRGETLHGRTIYASRASGEALVTSMGISFFGGVDPETGVVVERGHELEGQAVGGKVLVFSTGKGSTVGSYTLYRLKFNGHAPAAIVNRECETIVAVGCIIAEIPCVDQIAIDRLRNGMRVKVDAERATVEISEGSDEDSADSTSRQI
jgi:predicted aconitase with swiveling domain